MLGQIKVAEKSNEIIAIPKLLDKRHNWPSLNSIVVVENSLHWGMDMIFRDDECRIRTDHVPANFTTINVQHGGKRQWITLETGTLSRFKPAPHHARKRQWITQQTGTSGRGESAPASGRGSLLAGE